jgi:antitoxin (DNA-binding transcriptional repressor) of toxin-antitoxin stability system
MSIAPLPSLVVCQARGRFCRVPVGDIRVQARADPCHDDRDLLTKRVPVRVCAGRFKARCLELTDRVTRAREPIVITRRGRPVAKLVPNDGHLNVPQFGYMAGSARIRGDITKTPPPEWSAATGDKDGLYGGLGTRSLLPTVRGPRRTAKPK